jgi:thioredoxin reductase
MPKQVAVIGAGPAGLMAAEVLAQIHTLNKNMQRALSLSIYIEKIFQISIRFRRYALK